MKKLLIGLVLGTAVSLAVRKVADEGRKLHEHCREMMSSRCNHSNDGAVSSLSAAGSASPLSSS